MPKSPNQRPLIPCGSPAPYDDRLGVIEALWQVVLADGTRAYEEDALLRLVANLLGVTDTDSAMARQRVDAQDN